MRGGDLCRKVSSITEHFSCASTYSNCRRGCCQATRLSILHEDVRDVMQWRMSLCFPIRTFTSLFSYHPRLRAKNNPEKKIKGGTQTEGKKRSPDRSCNHTRFTATFKTVHIPYKVEKIKRLTPLSTVLVTGFCYMPLSSSSNDGLIGSIQDQ